MHSWEAIEAEDRDGNKIPSNYAYCHKCNTAACIESVDFDNLEINGLTCEETQVEEILKE